MIGNQRSEPTRVLPLVEVDPEEVMTVFCGDSNLCYQREVRARCVPSFEHLLEVLEHLRIHLAFVEWLGTVRSNSFTLLVPTFCPASNIEEEPVVVLVEERFVRVLARLDEIRDSLFDIARVMQTELDLLDRAGCVIDWCVDLSSRGGALIGWCPSWHG